MPRGWRSTVVSGFVYKCCFDLVCFVFFSLPVLRIYVSWLFVLSFRWWFYLLLTHNFSYCSSLLQFLALCYRFLDMVLSIICSHFVSIILVLLVCCFSYLFPRVLKANCLAVTCSHFVIIVLVLIVCCFIIHFPMFWQWIDGCFKEFRKCVYFEWSCNWWFVCWPRMLTPLKIWLTSLVIPSPLRRLFTDVSSPSAISFRQKIRLYNSLFSFTSSAVWLDKHLASLNHGVYTFPLLCTLCLVSTVNYLDKQFPYNWLLLYQFLFKRSRLLFTIFWAMS